MAVYEAGCSAIHLPLEPSNPLLAILKQAVLREGGERAVGQALASALLENVLQAVDEQADSFPPLIVRPCCSWHALSLNPADTQHGDISTSCIEQCACKHYSNSQTHVYSLPVESFKFAC